MNVSIEYSIILFLNLNYLIIVIYFCIVKFYVIKLYRLIFVEFWILDILFNRFDLKLIIILIGYEYLFI